MEEHLKHQKCVLRQRRHRNWTSVSMEITPTTHLMFSPSKRKILTIKTTSVRHQAALELNNTHMIILPYTWSSALKQRVICGCINVFRFIPPYKASLKIKTYWEYHSANPDTTHVPLDTHRHTQFYVFSFFFIWHTQLGFVAACNYLSHLLGSTGPNINN